VSRVVIELLFGVALASAVPVGFAIAIGLLGEGPSLRTRPGPVVGLVVGLAAALSVLALLVGRGPLATTLAIPWWLAAVGLAVAMGIRAIRDLVAGRLTSGGRLGAAVATGFLAVGATWLILDRAAVRPFDFDRTIVLLTAVHFHVAGFVLTLAGLLAARRRPGTGIHLAVGALIVGTPLTALGFFGLPLLSWLGAVLVSAAGIAIGASTVAISRGIADGVARWTLLVGGATLFVTMPLAVGYASGSAFGIPFLDIPAMAAIHGSLNVTGFAIPTMVGWDRASRSEAMAAPMRGLPADADRPVGPGDVISFNRLPFIAGPAIGLIAVAAAIVLGGLPGIVRLGLGVAGVGALSLTAAAVIVTWRVFGADAAARWDWVRSASARSTRWLNLTTGFDDSTGRLQAIVDGVGRTIDVFDLTRAPDAPLRRAREAFPPAGLTVPVAGLAAVVEPASAETVFLLMSAHETHGHERHALFLAARQALGSGGRVVLVEHLRDLANIVAFGPGAWQFSRRDDWLRSASEAGLVLIDERRLDPWVSGFVFGRATT
jgi:hypothetical protein